MNVGLLSSACVLRCFGTRKTRQTGGAAAEYSPNSLVADSVKVKDGANIQHVEPARARVGHCDVGKVKRKGKGKESEGEGDRGTDERDRRKGRCLKKAQASCGLNGCRQREFN